MILDQIKEWTGWLGGLAALLTLAVIFFGIFRGLRRPTGRTTGRSLSLLQSPVFYILTSLAYFGLCILLWRPIPVIPSPAARLLLFAIGAPVYFSGLGLILWSRLALGKLYFVSTSQGAQLFRDHRLITYGPYAWVRHPLYLGILLTGLGGILLYQTWTCLFFALNFLGLLIRARREEEALRVEFGNEWLAYCQRVPRWVPLIKIGKKPAIPFEESYEPETDGNHEK